MLSAAEHSYVCDDVKQALKKCKPPINFELLETHLEESQVSWGCLLYAHTAMGASALDCVLGQY